MKSNQLKLGSLLSYFQMGLSVVIGLLYTPVMIRLLGQSEYGLYNTVASTISMLSVLNLGFNSSYIRYFAKYKKENDQESIYKLNGLYIIIFSVIGIIAFACGMFLTGNLELVFADGLTEREYEIARVLMLLLTINLSVSFPMGLFSNIISAHEHYVVLKLLGMVRTVAGPFITLPLLLMGYRSIAMVSVTVGVSIFTDLCYGYYTIRKLKQRFIFKDFEKGIFKSLFVYTGFIAINLIIDQINWNVAKYILARFRGTESVAIYSVGYALYSYYQLFSTSISGVFAPKIHRIINTIEDMKAQRKSLTDLFVKVGRIQYFVLALISSGIVFFGKSFILNIWAGEGYDHSYYVALLLIIPASIALIQNLGIEIQRAENKHQFRSIVYLIMALLNLGVSIYLCQIYGAIGSAIGTAVSLVVANGLIMNIYYHKKCNLDIICFWKNILSASKGLILPVIAGILLVKFTDRNNLLIWVADVGVYALVYGASMWLFGMNKYEKGLITGAVGKVLRKFKK